MALLCAAVSAVVVVSDVRSAADENSIANLYPLNASDMHSLGNGHLVANFYRRLKALIIERSNCLQPEVALNVEPRSKVYESRTVDTASRTQVQTGSVKQPAEVCALYLGQRAPD